jgi:replication-associated recombination protein RarA
MECLPPAHAGRQFYHPTDRGYEAEVRRRLAALRKAKPKA